MSSKSSACKQVDVIWAASCDKKEQLCAGIDILTYLDAPKKIENSFAIFNLPPKILFVYNPFFYDGIGRACRVPRFQLERVEYKRNITWRNRGFNNEVLQSLQDSCRTSLSGEKDILIVFGILSMPLQQLLLGIADLQVRVLRSPGNKRTAQHPFRSRGLQKSIIGHKHSLSHPGHWQR